MSLDSGLNPRLRACSFIVNKNAVYNAMHALAVDQALVMITLDFNLRIQNLNLNSYTQKASNQKVTRPITTASRNYLCIPS
jgi:hypothetical protein